MEKPDNLLVKVCTDCPFCHNVCHGYVCRAITIEEHGELKALDLIGDASNSIDEKCPLKTQPILIILEE